MPAPGELEFIEHEIKNLNISTEEWESYAKVLDAAGFSAATRPQSIASVIKLHKIYANINDPEKVKDILLGRSTLTRADVDAAMEFYGNHVCRANGSYYNEGNGRVPEGTTKTFVNEKNMDEIVAVQDAYLLAVKELITIDDLADVNDIEANRKNEDALDCFMHLYLDASQCYERLRGERRSQVGTKYSHNKDESSKYMHDYWETASTYSIFHFDMVNMQSKDHAMYNTFVYQMFYPLIKNKTTDQLLKMYPKQGGRNSYFDTMALTSELVKPAFTNLTEEEVMEYQKTGAWPSSVDKKQLQELYDNQLAELESLYSSRNKAKVKAYNIPAPLVFDHENVPAFEDAAKRIADEARALMESKIGSDLPQEERDKILEDYSAIVETQIKRILLKDGYVKKCKEAQNQAELEREMQAFTDKSSNILPSGISNILVKQATDTALEGVMDLYPEQTAVLGNFTMEGLGYEDNPQEERSYTIRELDGLTHLKDKNEASQATDILENVGLMAVQREISIASMVRMYKISTHPELARDILMGKSPITDDDVVEALDFYSKNACAQNNQIAKDGKIFDKTKTDQVIKVSDAFYRAYDEIELSDMCDVEDIQSIRANKDVFENQDIIYIDAGQCFQNYRGASYSVKEYKVEKGLATRTEAKASLVTMLSQSLNVQSSSAAFATTFTLRTLAPLIKGRTNSQLGDMYPTTAGKKDNYVFLLYIASLSAFTNLKLTTEEVVEYQNTGKFPERISAEQWQSLVNNIMLEAANDLKHDNPAAKLKDYNTPAPIIVDHKGVPEFESAAAKIAESAKMLMRNQLGDNLPAEEADKIIEDYGRLFETQLKRLIVEDGYVDKSRAVIQGDELQAEMTAFINGQTNALPSNISMELISKASSIAVTGMKTYYPAQSAAFNRMQIEGIEYTDIKSAFLTGLGNLDEEVEKIYAENPVANAAEISDMQLAKADEISDITATPKIDANQERIIKNVNLKSPDFNSMDLRTAAYSFDTFAQNIPWVANNLGNIAVTENISNPTELFYIDGQSVDSYLRKNVNGYDNLSQENKVDLAKATIMNSLVSGSHNVDAKGYVQTRDNKCEVKVSNVVYADYAKRAEGFFRRRGSQTRAAAIVAADNVAGIISDKSAAYANIINNAGIRQQTEELIAAENREQNRIVRRVMNQYQRDGSSFQNAVDDNINVNMRSGENPEIEFVALAKMYHLHQRLQAKKQNEALIASGGAPSDWQVDLANVSTEDVLLNSAEVNSTNVADMFQFFEDHTLESEDLFALRLVDSAQLTPKIEEIIDIQRDYMHTAISANVDSIVNLTDINSIAGKKYEISRMAEAAAQYKSFFVTFSDAILKNKREMDKTASLIEPYRKLTTTFSYYEKTLNILNDMSFGNGYSAENVRRAFSATLAYNALGPVIKGKTAEELEKIYPVNVAGRSYLDCVTRQMDMLVNLYRQSGITAGDVEEFQRTGNLPDGINKQKFQMIYNQALEDAKEEYVKGGGKKLQEYEEAIPQLMDKENVPDMDKAAKRIAAEAMISLERQYISLNNRYLDPKIKKEYGRLVETQVKKSLLESGYPENCKNAALNEDLANDMDEFAKHGGVLPYFISKDIVNNATKNALKGLNTYYPDTDFGKVDTSLHYAEGRPELITAENVFHIGAHRDAAGPEITFGTPKGNIVAADHEAVENSIRNIDYTVNTMSNMVDAAREFDKLIKQFPGYTESLNNPDISASCKGQVTNLFYIDGMPVDQYLEANIPGYKRATISNKQNFAKVAIMQALVKGEPPVDALYYSHDGKMNCNLEVRTLIYKPSEKSAEVLEEERASRDSRVDSILEANKPIVDSINAKAKEAFEGLHNGYLEQAVQLSDARSKVNVLPDPEANVEKVHKAPEAEKVTEKVVEETAEKQKTAEETVVTEKVTEEKNVSEPKPAEQIISPVEEKTPEKTVKSPEVQEVKPAQPAPENDLQNKQIVSEQPVKNATEDKSEVAEQEEKETRKKVEKGMFTEAVKTGGGDKTHIEEEKAEDLKATISK
ncbi:MAG: hypothetical protein LUI60_05995 [Clostridia bacterium]|nr:hypothetical protein [Clostridia bacterium]